MSWPDLACASAAPVSSSLLPCEVMKSIWTSTFSLSAHSLISVSVASLALGTQWSQKPTRQLAGGMGAAHERRGDERRRQRQRYPPQNDDDLLFSIPCNFLLSHLTSDLS